MYGEVVRIIEKENAIEVLTTHWGNRVVIAPNAYWQEKLAKKGKIVKLKHNYKQWAQEYFNDEETENNNRVDPIHNGQPKEDKSAGENLGDDVISRSSKRKQKVVRKSTTKRRKSPRNRSPRGKKE